MKIISYNLIIILLLSVFTLTKEECQDDEISISGLGKCKKISEIIGNVDLNLKTSNLLYLASNEDGKINKSGYKLDIYKLSDAKLQSHNMRKSKIYIPNTCLQKMENAQHFGLDKNKAIIIIVYDSNNLNENNISDNYFIILHIDANDETKYITSKVNDFSFCHDDPILFEDEIEISKLKYATDDNTPINMDKTLYGRKFGIDLFDPYSDFLTDICFKFTSEKGSDVTLESRVEDYYQNISFCDDNENSHYLAYNYSETKKTFTFRCAFGYYKDEEDKSSYLDILDNKLKSTGTSSNLKVITCYKQFLNLKDIIRNYGGMTCILVLIIQIVCFLIFCLYGIKPIEDKLDDLFILGKAILRRLSKWTGFNFGLNQEKNNDKLNNGQPRKKFNLWGQIKKLRERRLLQEKNNKKHNPPKKKKSAKNKIDSEEVKIEINDLNNNDIDNTNKNLNINKDTKNENLNENKEQNSKSKKKKKNKKDKNKKESLENKEKNISKESGENQLISSNENPQDIQIKVNEDSTDKNSKNKEKVSIFKSNQEKTEKIVLIDDDKKSKNDNKNTDDKKTNDDKEEDKEQLYEYEADELNELPLDKALICDKRSFCRYYGNILFFSHIILNVFFRHNDYNLFTVKLGLLFMTFPINLTMNIFFFTNKSIKLTYIKNMDDISSFWSNIDNTVYSSILANAILIILKLICLTHNSVRVLRKIKDVNFAQEQSVCVLRCIKVRIVIYYILSFVFLIVFGFYVLSFCAIFENTQIELVKSTFTSWLISLLYPFIICFITSLIRKAAFKCKSKCLHNIKRIMQFL